MSESKKNKLKFKSKNGKTIYLNWQHAKNLLEIQQKNGHQDWELDEKELTFENGDFRKRKSAQDSKG